LNLHVLDSFDFFTGVPDSLLHPLSLYLADRFAEPAKHIIAANEGNCAAIAAGYHLATGKVPVVYMQNSGIGNVLNPTASLLNHRVYGIPVLFIIGWRGEPLIHDEPQHLFQGEITLALLNTLGLETLDITKDIQDKACLDWLEAMRSLFREGKSAVMLVRKDAFTYPKETCFINPYTMSREDAVRCILKYANHGAIVSTTGMASRELYALRAETGQGHERDFLTVGSMGHASSIALGIALHTRDRKIYCIDGDGAALMHMGALAVIGAQKPPNLIHILINNAAHDTVGGMPTVADKVVWPMVARGCGYPEAVTVDTYDALGGALRRAIKSNVLWFIEVKVRLGARAGLGRPSEPPIENKRLYMEYLQSGIIPDE